MAITRHSTLCAMERIESFHIIVGFPLLFLITSCKDASNISVDGDRLISSDYISDTLNPGSSYLIRYKLMLKKTKRKITRHCRPIIGIPQIKKEFENFGKINYGSKVVFNISSFINSSYLVQWISPIYEITRKRLENQLLDLVKKSTTRMSAS